MRQGARMGETVLAHEKFDHGHARMLQVKMRGIQGVGDVENVRKENLSDSLMRKQRNALIGIFGGHRIAGGISVMGVSEGCEPSVRCIRNAIDRTVGKFTKAQLLETCPDISETTMERTLKQLLDARFIRKIGAGRGSAYCKA
jgi:hypothetical protein